MQGKVSIRVEDVLPTTGAVLRRQGIPKTADPDVRLVSLANESIVSYREKAKPIGMVREISKEEFDTVYNGEGNNAAETPLDDIYMQADSLMLFAVTVGEPLSVEISHLFETNDYAKAGMLDATASEGAEMAALVLVRHCRQQLTADGRFDASSGILDFSPGYCGWHVSGQKKLFAHLQPGEIGIELSESCLMRPLKSISGVIVAGRKTIFGFDDCFPFCAECETHSCQDRARAVLEHQYGQH